MYSLLTSFNDSIVRDLGKNFVKEVEFVFQDEATALAWRTSPELVKQANAEACGWLGASLTYKNSGDYTAGSQATSTVPYVKKMA